MRRLATLLLVAALAAPAAAQEQEPAAKPDLPKGVVARVYDRDVPEDEFLARLADRYASTEHGTKVLGSLVDDICVLAEADKRGVSITDAEAKEWVEKTEERIRKESAGTASLRDLFDLAEASEEDFFATVRIYLLQERMARKDLGGDPEAELPDHRRKLWVAMIRRRYKVRFKDLPDGALAAVGDRRVTRIDLARGLRDRLPDEMVLDVRTQLVLGIAASRALEKAGIEVTPDDVDAQVDRLRERVEESPRFRQSGVKLEQWLEQTRGKSLEEYRTDEDFLSGVALRKLLSRDLSDGDVRRHWERNPDAYGDRALVRQVFVPAGKESGEFDVRTFKVAYDLALRAKIQVLELTGAHLEKKDRVRRLPEVVTMVAKRFETDVSRRDTAGEPSAWSRGQIAGQKKLTEAVFDTGELNTLLGPIRSDVGYHVLVVQERRPAPTFDEIRERVHEDVLKERLRKFQLELRADPNIVFGN